jgi:hypothetical protein
MLLSFWLRSLRTALGRFATGRTHHTTGRRPRGRTRLSVEALEDRTVPTTFVVTNTLGDGTVGSLAWAINQVNTDTTDTAAQPDVINFNITAASDAAAGGTGFNATTGVATITPQTALPVITNPVIINGYTEAGASPNTLTQGDNAVLKIQINLSAVPDQDSGLTVTADNTTIEGLVLNSLAVNIPAIGVSGSGDQIQGNFVGTDVTGTQVVGNASWGIELNGSNVVVGGTTPDTRNIISGNGNGPSTLFFDEGGILVEGTGNSVEGNYIGIDVTGTKALGNGKFSSGGQGGAGVDLAFEVNATIGGTAAGAGNLISGNQEGITNGGATDQIQGNLIGTDATGASAVGNGIGVVVGPNELVGGTTPIARNIISGNGVGIVDNAIGAVIEGNYIGTDITGTQAVVGDGDGVWLGGAGGLSGGTVGGAATGAGNVISGNLDGIRIFGNNYQIEGNLIGTDYTGTNPVPNATGIYGSGGNNNVIGGTAPGAGNVVAFNSQAGVAIYAGTGNAILGNSIHDNPSPGIYLVNGANNNQAAPVLQTVANSPTGLTVSGIVPGATGTFVVQVFANASSASGQGQTLIGSFTTDGSGNFTGTIAAASLPTNEPYLSATATVQNSNGTFGNSSEFSQKVAIPTSSAGGPYTMTYGGSLSLSASGNDPDGDTLTYSWMINGHAGAATGASPTLTWAQLQALGVNSAQPFNVSVTADDGNGATAISANVQVSVNKATPSFSALSTPTVTVGTANVTISGTLSAGTLIPTGNFSIQVGSGTPVTAAINPDGTFSASVPVSSLAAGAYSVTFSYAGDGNFNAASASATMDVTYGVTLLSNLSHGQPAGSSFTIEVESTDASGNNLSATPASVTAVGFAPASNPTQITPVSDSGAFSPLPNAKKPTSWSYSLKTSKGLASGTFVFYFTIQGDPVTHSLTFQVK